MPDAMPAAEARVIERRLVAWCVECELYSEPSEIEAWCSYDDHTTLSGWRRLLKRWRWICSRCRRSWWNGDDAKGHFCLAERGPDV